MEQNFVWFLFILIVLFIVGRLTGVIPDTDRIDDQRTVAWYRAAWKGTLGLETQRKVMFDYRMRVFLNWVCTALILVIVFGVFLIVR